MVRKFAFPAAVAAVAAVIAGAGIADGASSPSSVHAKAARTAQLKVRTVLGRQVTVGPFDITPVGAGEYHVSCPSGYLVTGIGVLNGANDVVYMVPSNNGKGADFSFSNPSESESFQSAGTATCVKGASGLKAHISMTDSAKRQAVAQARAVLK